MLSQVLSDEQGDINAGKKILSLQVCIRGKITLKWLRRNIADAKVLSCLLFTCESADHARRVLINPDPTPVVKEDVERGRWCEFGF